MATSHEIPQTMKAVRYHGNHDLRLDTISPLPCGPDEVRLQIAFCGICGSDLHEYSAGPLFMPKHGEKHKYTGGQIPMTMGHEMSGVVVELGSAVVDSTPSIKLGQRVVVSPCARDKQLGTPPCAPCQDGMPNVCARLGLYGLNGADGGLAEYMVIKAVNVFPLPASISLQIGALVEPLAVAWHCVRISGFKSGQDAVVLGAGPIGLALLLVLKVWGAKSVIVSEILENRTNLAAKFGADYVINPLEKKKQDGDEGGRGVAAAADPVVVKSREVSGGLSGGAHVSFEATGIQSTFDTSIACTRRGGTIVNISIHEKPLVLNVNALALTEKRLMGSLCYTDEDIKAVIDALEDGSLRPESMITSVIPLDETVQGGFEELMHRRDNHVKILVQPTPRDLE